MITASPIFVADEDGPGGWYCIIRKGNEKPMSTSLMTRREDALEEAEAVIRYYYADEPWEIGG